MGRTTGIGLTEFQRQTDYWKQREQELMRQRETASHRSAKRKLRRQIGHARRMHDQLFRQAHLEAHPAAAAQDAWWRRHLKGF